MNLNTAKVTVEDIKLSYNKNGYVDNTIQEQTPVIEGSFYQVKPMTIREMVTRKINKSLCGCLILTILVKSRQSY